MYSDARRDAPPRLFDEARARFDKSLFAHEASAELLELTFARADDSELSPARSAEEIAAAARDRMRRENYDAVIYFPGDFLARLDAFRGELKHHGSQRKHRAAQDEDDGASRGERPEQRETENRPFHGGSRQRCGCGPVALERALLDHRRLFDQ